MNYIWNPEGERIASELIPKYHEHLQKVKIAYLFKAKPTAVELEGAVDTPKKRGRPRKTHAPGKKVWIAKCGLVSGKYRLLFTDDFKFIITADQEIWDELSEAQRVAVVDHELCHAVFDDEGNARLRKHELEEFRAPVQRWGFYLADIQAFYEACKRGEENANRT